ncbi:hypothetical protein F4802DRAFT_487135 [Xylaria palmicola]|nr:hypothetical protein F4802DRAFT_487135 [Xylaria palmicola]
MSVSAPRISNASADITYITSQPFEPKPLIADILRTDFCVPDSIFLVEGVDVAHTSGSKRWRIVRLLLGDGELCIQGLLSAEMHRLVDRGDVSFGSYVKLQRFRTEWRDAAQGSSDSSREHVSHGDSSKGRTGQMVFLIVESLVVVGWNNTLADPATTTTREEIGTDHVEAESEALISSQTRSPVIAPSKAEFPCQTAVAPPVAMEAADIEDDFEVMAISQDKAAQHREEVAAAIVKHERDNSTESTSLSWPRNNPSRSLKLTKLRSIPNLPYKQNWSVNVLCVVSAISEVEPAGIPPYTQRQARLTDPSTDKHVLLTVFLDPHLFSPRVGSVVLLTGVKNHRFDGGSLKKYASDRPRAGEDWWYEDPTQFSCYDVDGLRRWWARVGMQA